MSAAPTPDDPRDRGPQPGRTVLTYGTFDLLHVGHVRLLSRLRALGDRLVVGVSTDAFNATKGKAAVTPFADRCEMLLATRHVDDVFPEDDWDQKPADIARLGAAVLGMGSDWQGHFDDLSTLCEVVYLPRTGGISTSELRADAHAAHEAHLAARARASRPAPALSIVVPFYNPGPFWRPWLNSIRAQDLADFECLVIDDGTTDGSITALRDAVAGDARFTVLRQENRGVSAARNRGVAMARAPRLALADPDDIYPPAAMARLAARLDGDGSDYASGRVRRLTLARHHRSGMHRGFHDHDRLLTPATLDEGALYDQLCANKMFRTDFFRAAVGTFPETQRKYEDIAPMMRALLAARSVSVLSDLVLYWRKRTPEAAPSATQVIDAAALSARLAALDEAAAVLRDRRPDLWPAFLRKAIRHDLATHLAAVPAGNSAEAAQVMEGIARWLAAQDAAAAGLAAPVSALTRLIAEHRAGRALRLIRDPARFPPLAADG